MTGAVQLLDVLCTHFPQHHAIFADFSELPAPTLDAASQHHTDGSLNARMRPLVCGPRVQGSATKSSRVQEKKSRRAQNRKPSAPRPDVCDHDTYLVRGADIYFPTDFQALQHAYCQLSGKAEDTVRVLSTSEFMTAHGELHKTTCLSGYNPMVENYQNTRFFLSR